MKMGRGDGQRWERIRVWFRLVFDVLYFVLMDILGGMGRVVIVCIGLIHSFDLTYRSGIFCTLRLTLPRIVTCSRGCGSQLLSAVIA